MAIAPSPAGAPTPRLDVSDARRGGLPWWVGPMLVLVAVGAGTVAWRMGFRPQQLWEAKVVALPTVAVDRGDFVVLVNENGTLEAANSETVKCQVEAIIGTVGGTAGAGGRSGGGGGAGAARTPAAGGAATKGAATGKAAAGGAATKGASGAAGAGAGGGTDGATMQRPTIRSFTLKVTPHVPLRPQSAVRPATNQQQGAQDPSGGRGGRGGGGGGSNPFGQERAGSTRIISILPEGTPVQAGDVVCELDSSAFRDELQAQEIRYAQAKAWVDQAKAALEVSEITLREYRDGIYPQDLSLIRQYLRMCLVDYERAVQNLEWSKETYAQGYRASAQLQADRQALERAEIALREAEGMESRLTEFTMPRLLKSLEAKVEAARADMLAQASSFQLESDRLKRLKQTVENCILRAPRDGIVVYVNQTNGWGRTEAQIQEGATVREGQPIFQLPDPRYMKVRARINESRVAFVHHDQRVEVRIDAFPDRVFEGKVAEIVPIPAPAGGPFSDTKIYFATIDIDVNGYTDLKPGLSAEVRFLVDAKSDATRLPVEAVRWVDDRPFAAVAGPGPADYSWRPIQVGLVNESHVEVLRGLEPGDRVIARPDALPRPRGAELARTDAPARPRG